MSTAFVLEISSALEDAWEVARPALAAAPDDLIAAALGAQAEHRNLAFCADADLVSPLRVGVRAIVGEAVRGPHGVHVPLHWRAESDAFADFDGVLAIEHDDADNVVLALTGQYQVGVARDLLAVRAAALAAGERLVAGVGEQPRRLGRAGGRPPGARGRRAHDSDLLAREVACAPAPAAVAQEDRRRRAVTVGDACSRPRSSPRRRPGCATPRASCSTTTSALWSSSTRAHPSACSRGEPCCTRSSGPPPVCRRPSTPPWNLSWAWWPRSIPPARWSSRASTARRSEATRAEQLVAAVDGVTGVQSSVGWQVDDRAPSPWFG